MAEYQTVQKFLASKSSGLEVAGSNPAFPFGEMMDKENILEGSLCYLIGAMEKAPDEGITWRTKIIQTCKEEGLRIKFLDPTNKVAGLQEEIGEERKKILRMKKQGRWKELSQLMHLIVRQDHRCVDLSDFVIVYLDPTIHTCGTYFELRSAFAEKKPYFIIVEGGKKCTPVWLFGICNHEYIFNNVDEVIKELRKIKERNVVLSDKWVLFPKQLKNL
ncbi:hypothetical protein LCGC14_2353150 [marine sediment metagenome]|uniref:Uncharacterized protein n=1 Tax=marine sediment metagenome TaxID=412755 RepID=A0A0F9F3K4_9ZZZZ